jgi:hypothetical protein
MVKARDNNQDRKPRKRATIQDLPVGANDDNAWTHLVIPNFIRLIMSGEQPWFIGDDTIVSDLQDVWNHVYGRRVRFEVKRSTVPFNLISFFSSQYSYLFSFQAIQKLYDYQSKIVYQALCLVFNYLYNLHEDKDDVIMDASKLAKLANGLLENHDQFIFKGMENKHRVSQNWIS